MISASGRPLKAPPTNCVRMDSGNSLKKTAYGEVSRFLLSPLNEVEKRFHIVVIAGGGRIIRNAVLLKLPPFAKRSDPLAAGPG